MFVYNHFIEKMYAISSSNKVDEEVEIKRTSNIEKSTNSEHKVEVKKIHDIKGNKMTRLKNKDLGDIVENVFNKCSLEGKDNKLVLENLKLEILRELDLSVLKEKLDVLYNYEKNYLNLIKEFKEEIKFASSIQEDLRKERAKFFAETLKEVSNTLENSQVESKVASRWIEELVNSYTKSLDLSSGLIEESTLDTIGKLREQSKQVSKKSNIK